MLTRVFSVVWEHEKRGGKHVRVKTIVQRTLGIKNHVVTKVEWVDGGIRIHLDVRGRRRLPCVSCGTLGRLRDRLKERRWKHVPL